MSNATYSLQRVNGLDADVFARLVRTRFDSQQDRSDLDRFLADYEGDEIVQKIKDEWDAIAPYTPSDSNLAVFGPITHKRLLFWAIRPEKFFMSCNLTSIASYQDEVTEPVWDCDGVESTRTRKRRYEVYLVPSVELGIDDDERSAASDVGVLRCWCPSTGREHWIMFPGLILESSSAWGYGKFETMPQKDVVNTVLAYVFFGANNRWSREAMKIVSGHYLYRQGDLIFRRPDPSAPVYASANSTYFSSSQPRETPDILAHLKAEA